MVNNAGLITPGTTCACRKKNKPDSSNFPGALIDQDIGDVQRAFDTNVFGMWRMAKAVIPEMAKRRSGLIVNIGSSVGEVYVHTDDAKGTWLKHSLDQRRGMVYIAQPRLRHILSAK